ncbi:S8 family peptidase [Alkalihalophilus lindianensis]|uniref:S8 family peptidase n=1 Tax=Alkalihalophilus lindianensis TaxID=1630542 RepID=A0ABU3XFD2_9BACI|nr:S8 family peptidase [Alkalihalophilus lindianensis]MDV2685983.1 S8 family peptidase [Alkalihalophilus lindianensis]
MRRLFLALLLVILMAVPGQAVLAGNANAEVKDYLVQFDGAAQKGLVQAFGIDNKDIIHEYDLLPVMHLNLTENQARGLQNHPHVQMVEENAEVTKLAQTTPWGIPRVQGTAAQDAGFTGNGVKVAILDTGIDRNHPDLSANVKGGHSVFTDSANADPFFDGDGHGTHVAGTVAAVNNDIGVIGVANEASLYAVKVLNNAGSGSYAGIAEGIEWAINNDIDIINMSLGGSQSSAILKQFSDLAYAEGVLVVAAAGNSGTRSGRNDTVGYPAKYDSVIAVAATDQNNQRATFSSTGPAVEISAPGVGILSTTPNNNYASFNGTSMASPHVAGVAAQVWQAKPHLSNVELRNLLNETAINLGSSTQYGNGLVQSLAAIQQ